MILLTFIDYFSRKFSVIVSQLLILIRGRHISLRVMVGGPHNHFRFDDVSPFTLSNTQVKTDRT